MAKKIILAIFIIIILSIFAFNLISKETVDVYIDGENVSVSTHTMANINSKSLNGEICDYTLDAMNDSASNITTLYYGIKDICTRHGLKNPEINIDSSLGKNQIPIIAYVCGTSMNPTLKDGQSVLVNKTKNIHVGDIVIANSQEYGGIIKRVGEINDNRVHLESDNKNVDFEYINGTLYELKGISPWVDLSEINGVVIDYWNWNEKILIGK